MKWIQVTDLQGNCYAPTYPKRAKGLVKKGRARFVHADTICLTCPPISREETRMLQSNEASRAAEPARVTPEEILSELKKIREDTSHITLAMEKLEKVPTNNAEDAVCQDKIAAILQIAEQREKTNQALIQLYDKMYDDWYVMSQEDAAE